jgi:hypothetical protein
MRVGYRSPELAAGGAMVVSPPGTAWHDVAIAQGEPQIKPDRVLDDRWRKAMVTIREELHAQP